MWITRKHWFSLEECIGSLSGWSSTIFTLNFLVLRTCFFLTANFYLFSADGVGWTILERRVDIHFTLVSKTLDILSMLGNMLIRSFLVSTVYVPFSDIVCVT